MGRMIRKKCTDKISKGLRTQTPPDDTDGRGRATSVEVGARIAKLARGHLVTGTTMAGARSKLQQALFLGVFLNAYVCCRQATLGSNQTGPRSLQCNDPRHLRLTLFPGAATEYGEAHWNKNDPSLDSTERDSCSPGSHAVSAVAIA